MGLRPLRSCPYSPNVVEEKFCELRQYKILGSSVEERTGNRHRELVATDPWQVLCRPGRLLKEDKPAPHVASTPLVPQKTPIVRGPSDPKGRVLSTLLRRPPAQSGILLYLLGYY